MGIALVYRFGITTTPWSQRTNTSALIVLCELCDTSSSMLHCVHWDIASAGAETASWLLHILGKHSLGQKTGKIRTQDSYERK